jgi:arylsulfatase A-like enzyme
MDSHKREGSGRAFGLAGTLGLGWGLAFGFVDGLAALLEGDLAVDLGRRLVTLVYVVALDAAAFGLALALVGLGAWAVLRVARRRVAVASLIGLYAGLCAALSVAGYLVQRYPDGAWPVTVALAVGAGVVGGWLVRAAGRTDRLSRSAGDSSLASLVQNDRFRERGTGSRGLVVGGVFAFCVAVLLGQGLYHGFVRDLPALNPRVTDQVATPERLNIVLVSIDALRADGLGVYGNDPAVSPRIDELARQGIVFQQATSQGSSTVPSVSSFLTSLYPTELGMAGSEDRIVDDLRVTLAEALQAAGYRTQAYVTNGHLVPARGYGQGFDDYVAPEPGRPYGLDRLRSDTVVAGLSCRWIPLVCDLVDGGYRLLFDRLLVMEDEGGRVNDRARRFIRLHAGEQFFLWLHYMEPHAAYRPQQAFGDLPASVGAERETVLREWQPSNKTSPTVLRPDDVTALRSLYDGEVLEVDGWVGGIWDEIEALGLADRTLLVITADHGDEFGEHGDYGHGHTVYQDLDWVPLIFAGPQVASPGRVVQKPVPLLDLMPTLIDVAQAPRPDLMRGQSLLPVLQGGEPPQRAIVSESPASRSRYDDRSLRVGDDKLVYNLRLDRVELYNLRADPGEQNDLATVEPDRAAAMRDELRAWTVGALETWASLPQSGREAGELDAALEDALRQIGY